MMYLETETVFTTQLYVLVSFRVFQLKSLNWAVLGVVPTTNVADFRKKICEFAKRQGRQIAEKLFLFLVYDHPQCAAGHDQYLDQNVVVLGKWAGYNFVSFVFWY